MKRARPLKRMAPPPKSTREIARTLKPLNAAGGRAKRNPLARGFTQRVFALYGAKCVECGARATQAHHAIARQTIVNADHLTAEERLALEYDARNGVPVCTACHERHEKAFRRIRRSRLPRGVIEWAREHGFEGRLDRIYGPGGR